jgi:microcystin-dependent protein
MSDQYLGEIRMFAGNYAPEGWAMCNGQLLMINQNEALYSLIGTTYGGDGQTTFALPDLQGRVPVHTGRNNVTGTVYPLGQKGGTETVTLVADQLPRHTHAVNAQSQAGTSSTPDNNYWATGQVNLYASTAANGTMGSSAIGITGGNMAHNNVMPYFAVSFIIALQGIYPSQN